MLKCFIMFFVLFITVLISSTLAENKINGRVFTCSSGTGDLDVFKCSNEDECVNKKYVCDGNKDCTDGSDEKYCLFHNTNFRNQSDVVEALRRKRMSSSSSVETAGCFLPSYPDHGTYTVSNVENAYPGQYLDFFHLTVTCRQGYGVVGSEDSSKNRQVYCLDGAWSQQMPKCVRFCKLNIDPSVEYICHEPGKSTKVCKNYVAPGTIVNPVCNTPYYHSFENLANMNCIGGYWDYVARCKAECGRVTPQSELLIISGNRAKHGELPWHAGIYLKTTEPYKQICGGTLVSNNVIVSAAHCFWNDLDKLLPASDYAVAVGKLYRPWNNPRDVNAQKSDVKEIKIPTLFKGEATNYQEDIAVVVMATPVVYKTYVRPVCLSFNLNFDTWQLQRGKLGKVAGWGLTTTAGNASPVLQVVDLPYVNEDVCINNVPTSFREYLTADKFCAGYTNGTALCKGDSGGGLVFADKELGITRYYIRGVVSAAPKSLEEKLCNDNAYTAFTKISKHEEFIKKSMAASLNKTCSPYLFQCDNGDCVDQGADCNGIQECTDGSDEADELCSAGSRVSNRVPEEVCVLPAYPDNGSYEVVGQPKSSPGQSLDFFELTVKCRQGYGLVDSTKETFWHGIHSVSCRKGQWLKNMPKCVPKCQLNPDPSVRYMCKDLESQELKECGSLVSPGSVVYPSCVAPNYFPGEDFTNMTCKSGTWDYVVKCKTAYCSLKPDSSISYKCQDSSGSGSKACEGMVAPGTRVQPICNVPHYYEADGFQIMTCISGSWDHQSKCIADCGRPTIIAKPETNTTQEYMPWQVTVYEKVIRYYNYQCLGTLIKNDVVMSVAYQFWDPKTGRLKAKGFGVGAGEFFRIWEGAKNTEAQHSDVKQIKVPSEYRGVSNYHVDDLVLLILEKPLTYTMYIKPVCLNFDDTLDIRALDEGQVGKLNVWGRKTRGDTLSRQLVDLTMINSDTCAHTLPDWSHLIIGDKFCGSLTNETFLDTLTVSGGAGCVFPRTEGGIERYYLRGMEQNDCLAASGTDCNGNNYIILMRVIRLKEFIEPYLK